MKKIAELTLNGQPIDDLLVENIATMRARIEIFAQWRVADPGIIG